MKPNLFNRPLLVVAGLIAMSFIVSSCASTQPSCSSPQTKNLGAAIDTVKASLMEGCHAHFDRFYDDLLSIAEVYPIL